MPIPAKPRQLHLFPALYHGDDFLQVLGLEICIPLPIDDRSWWVYIYRRYHLRPLLCVLLLCVLLLCVLLRVLLLLLLLLLLHA
jgi:hypothetical protein